LWRKTGRPIIAMVFARGNAATGGFLETEFENRKSSKNLSAFEFGIVQNNF
jgi:hypothetical protein